MTTVNTCRLTIDHHPETDQCGEDMITHAVHIEPVNVDAPQWVLDGATSHMCADPRHYDVHFLPDITHTIQVMDQQDLHTLVVLAPDYWDIEFACTSGENSRIGRLLRQVPERHQRDADTDAVVLDLAAGTVAVTTRTQAWEAGTAQP